MISDRIRRARTLKGMSLQEVADSLGDISKQALSKYENGQDTPNSTRLIQLARVFGVKPDYFFRSHEVELGAIDFRKHVRFGAKQQEAIKERVRDHLERYLAVEDMLEASGARKQFSLHQEYPCATPEEAEAAAEALRAKWNLGLDAIQNLIELLEEHGVKVVMIDAQDEFSGMKAELTGTKDPVVVINQSIPGDRQRFTAAHELGHLVMQISENASEQEKENFCHRFAGAFLIPRDCVLEEFGVHRNRILMEELKLAKQAYGISIQALVRRLWELQVIPKASFDFWMTIIRRWGKKEPEDTQYRAETSDRMRLLVCRALAEGILTPSRASELLDVSLEDIEEIIGSEDGRNAVSAGL